MDTTYEHLTQRYAPHFSESLVFYFVAEEVAKIPEYPYLKLVVNKPARVKRATVLTY